METVPTGGFLYHFTPLSGGNSETFSFSTEGFLGRENPFTITNTSAWTVSSHVRMHCNRLLFLISLPPPLPPCTHREGYSSLLMP